MTKAIVICTWYGGQETLGTLLRSLNGYSDYPIVIVINGYEKSPSWWLTDLKELYQVIPNYEDTYELGALKQVYLYTQYEEFIFLQDTIEVKNTDIFRILFEDPRYAGKSIQYGHKFQSYLGKFRKIILKNMGFPEDYKIGWESLREEALALFSDMPEEKREAMVGEVLLTKAYLAHDPHTVIFNDTFSDFRGTREFMFGRENLRLEDDYLIKRKGTWR